MTSTVFKSLPLALAQCYFFQVDLTSPFEVSGMRYAASDWTTAMDPVVKICKAAQRGVLWVDKEKNQTWNWKVKCHLGKCDCKGRVRKLFTVVVEDAGEFNIDQINADYAFLEDDESKRVVYDFSRTKSRKTTYFFFHEKYRDHLFDTVSKHLSATARTLKHINAATANWLPFYQKYGHLSGDALHRNLISQRLSKAVCVPFVYIECLGKHRRQDRMRYLLLEKPDERLDVAQKRSKRMYAAQSKGKTKKAFAAELLGRLERMNALWPDRIPTWAPFIETCVMLDFRIGITTI
jgi:hypothetical protein